MNKTKQAFTLVEVVIALLFFSILVVITMPIFLSANALNNQSDARLYGQTLGQETLETLIQRASVINDDNQPPKSIFEGFSLFNDTQDDFVGQEIYEKI